MCWEKVDLALKSEPWNAEAQPFLQCQTIIIIVSSLDENQNEEMRKQKSY